MSAALIDLVFTDAAELVAVVGVVIAGLMIVRTGLTWFERDRHE